MGAAFTNPARYELYDCPQLEAERIRITSQLAEIRRLREKAETGVAGSAVAEMAYGTEYVTLRGRSDLAEETWRRNKCTETPPVTDTPTAPQIRNQGKSPATKRR